MTTILSKRSGTAASAPLPANLAQGELAINYADQKLFAKNVSNVVEQINAETGLLRSQIATSRFAQEVIYLSGEAALGDYGFGARYVRGTSGGTRAIQDANSVWWNLQILGEPFVNAGWFGNTAATLQTAINTASTANIGSVFVPPGTYTLTTALQMRSNVKVWANPGTVTITQGNAANLALLIDFNTNTASGATIEGLIIDGNRANNTINVTTDKFVINVGVANSVTIRNNEIANYSGHGIYVTSGLNVLIEENFIHHLNMYGIYMQTTVAGTRNQPVIRRNRINLINWHAIAAIKCTDARIEENDIIGTRIGSSQVTVSGTTVTWVSGTNFANVEPGMFIIYNGGVEALVTAKASSTSLTINFAAGNATNVPGVFGSADVIGSWSSTNTRISRNKVTNGASLGISIFSDQATFGASDIGAVVENNILEGIGSGGLSIQASAGGNTVGTRFLNNECIECGLNGAASDASFNTGLGIQGPITDINVIGNSFISYGSAMSPMHILSTDLGQIRTASNRSKTNAFGYTNGAVVGSFTGWGTGATCTINQVSDDFVLMTVVSGTGVSASPSITIQHRNLPVRYKMPSGQMIGTTGVVLPFVTFLPDPATESTIVLSGTPGSSTTYYILLRL